jgi:hypothetical protein
VALALWSGFPVQAKPRPIIPLGEGVVVAPGTGFPDGDTKLAYVEGRFRLRVAFPGGPAEVGLSRVISAADAYDRLRAAGRSGTSNVRPLVVRAVHLGSATFVTDRGRRRLPAWRCSFRRVAQPASVLALAPPDLFRPPPRRQVGPTGTGNSMVDSARSNRSGTAITLSFVGAPPGTVCAAIGYARHAVLHLSRPLGARVLVSSSDGGAVPVTR